ncbi:MAG: 50S ribosomal protein L1 [Chloroflexi bacterium]|nr:50S ribosomal protein L1 [Chloroflexota bacterium]
MLQLIPWWVQQKVWVYEFWRDKKLTTEPSLRGRGKRYKQSVKDIEHGRHYNVDEAIELLKLASSVKFDETFELHLRTNADPRHADQQIRSVSVLPHGTGKAKTVIAFVQGSAVALARESGADFIGDEETIKRIETEGWVDFDVAIATPDVMGQIGKLGRVLGRKGLMPNPRTGTVVQPEDIGAAINEVKQGRVEFRMDRSGNIHVAIGKVSFQNSQVAENLFTVVGAITRAKPDGIKGSLFKSIHLTTTMGPSISLDIGSVQNASI